MRNRKKQSLKFIIVLVLICFGIGYAYLTTNLSINGITDIDANNWNIYWNNVQVTTGSVTGDQVTQAPTIDTNKTSVSFHVRLKEPGEFYEFTVDAVNAGTIDAMINTIAKTIDLPTYFRYKITYINDYPISEKQLLNANSTETYKVRVEYRTDINPEDLPSSPQSLDLSYGVEYIQADDNAVALPNSTFMLDCAKDKFYFDNGMTFGNWIQSKYYPGFVGGEFSSLNECINAWGPNAGCSHRNSNRYYYIYVYDGYGYTESLDECNYEGINCTVVNNSVYKGEYAYKTYDTYEECKAESEYNDCELINGKYIDTLHYEYFSSLENCNSLSWADYYSCNLLPAAYRYNPARRIKMNSLEDCIAEHSSDECITEAYEFYGPNTKNGSVNYFTFYNSSSMFYNDFSNYYFRYDDVLENKTYECDVLAECVSPESDILNGNGKTIKAKDIKENDLIVYYNFDTNRTEIGRVSKVYVHKDATNLIRYEFEDNTYLEATDYHPIYTKEGWKSYTNRNGYPKPVIGDLVKTNTGYKRITKIVPYTGKEDYYDFQVISKDGKLVNNYYANGTLVQGSY